MDSPVAVAETKNLEWRHLTECVFGEEDNNGLRKKVEVKEVGLEMERRERLRDQEDGNCS